MTTEDAGFRLSPEQAGLWAGPGTVAARWTQCLVPVPAVRSADQIRAALGRVVARHEILRTGFAHVPLLAEAVQVVHESAPPEPRVTSLAALEPAVRAAALEELLRRERATADLASPPLLRVTLAEGDGTGLLIVSAPALVADARALRVLAAELEAECLGTGAAGRDIVQYADYAQWRLDADPAPAAEADEFWSGQCSATEGTAAEPRDVAPAPDSVAIPVPAVLRRQIAVLAEERGLPLPAVLMAAWWLVLALSGWSAEGPLWVVTDRREDAALDDAVGWFEQRLPLASLPRGHATAEGTFNELTTAVAGLHAAAVRWRDQLPRQEPAARGPRAGFRFIHGESAAPPSGTRLLAVDDGYAADLTAWTGADGLVLELGFHPGYHDRAAAAALGGRLVALLGELCARGDLRLAELDIRTPGERAAAAERDGTAAPAVTAGAVENFRAQVASGPDRVALVCGARHVSYAALDDQARRIAASLRDRGCRPGDRVGICLPRSPDQVAAVLGTWYAGAAFVAVSPEDPESRTVRLLELAGCRWVLTAQGEQRPGGQPEGGPPARLPVAAALARPAPPDDDIPVRLPLGATTCVAFTSGSTGEPQGVLSTGLGLANYLAYLTGEYHLAPGDVALQLAPITFDAWLRDTIGPLTAGASVVILDELAGRSADAIVAHIERHQVTCLLHIVPTLLREVIRAARERPAALPALRTVLCSGEPLRQRDCDEVWVALGSRITVVNQYGPTECTLTSTFFRAAPAADGAAPVPIGRPVRGAVLHVLDEDLRPVPDGVIGEVHLGGAGVSDGYLGQPALTALRFVPDPFSARPGARLYRTGDLARPGPGGKVVFLGRRDTQVKIRGVRVDPAEIERILLGHPGVREAVVVACRGLPPEPGQFALTACVVLADDGPGPGELRSFAAHRLPAAMVPAVIMAFPAIPRGPHGKVDRRSLTAEVARRAGQPAAAGPFTAPRSLLEQAVADVFAQVLGLERVGVDDDFFTLGGHSLLATRAMYQLSQRLRLDIPLRPVFEYPTPAGLAARIAAAADGPDAPRGRRLAACAPGELTREPGGQRSPGITQVTGPGPHPLSFAQLRMWLVGQLYPLDTSHNVHVTVEIAGPLAQRPLRMALDYLGSRHEMLRTGFVAGPDGQPGQVAFARAAPDVTFIDLTADDSGAPVASLLADYSRRTANLPFDLGHPPLWRASLLRTGPDRHVLLLTAHHIVIDEWSVGVLLRELAQAYTAFLGGGEPDIPPPPVRYADYAAWQRGWLTERRLGELLGYWREQLGDAPLELELPFDFPRPDKPSMRGERLARPIGRDLADRLAAAGQESGATLYMVLLAVFAALLSHYGRSADIVVGTPVANRDRAELDNVVGCFVNIVVLRVPAGGDPSFADLLQHVREAALGAFAHQDAPFEKVVEALRPNRVLGRIPLVQNWFVLHNAAHPAQTAPGIRLTLLESDRGSSKFDLNLALSATADGLSAALEYSADLFRPETAERMLRRYCELLETVAARPDTRLSQMKRQIETDDEKERKVAADDRRQSRRKSFTAARARTVTPVRVSSGSLVRFGRLTADEPLPAVVRPGDAVVDLAGWVAANREDLAGRLTDTGAILFRGFAVTGTGDFERVAAAYSPDMVDYYERSTPRQVISGKVYSSTEYPQERVIPLHPESAYSHYWPRTLWFCCLAAPASGGATPLADNRRILRSLDPEVRARFTRRGIRYIRTYHEGFDISWQNAFQTEDRQVVEDYCRRAGLSWQWRPDGVLRTEHVLDSVVRHPVTGEELWFNQVHAWHISALEPAAQQAMLSTFGADNLPRNVTYGDGSPIEPGDIGALGAAHEEAAVRFPWQHGDVLLIDNMLVSHGREPYSGERRVVVAMSDPYDRSMLLSATQGIPAPEGR